MTRIAHLTSAHPREDTRVFLKQCCGLAAKGFDVTLVVADGKGDEKTQEVKICDVGSSSGRIARIIGTTRRVYSKAVALDADLYHLHDPELLLIAPLLRRRGKRVIFDAHEDLPKQILHKNYLSPFVGKLLAFFVEVFEAFICRHFLDGIVAATPSISRKFQRIHPRCVNINNYPVIGELDAQTSWDSKASEVCYVGYISKSRGIQGIIEAMAMVDPEIRLNLGGVFSEDMTHEDMKGLPGWDRVNELGFIDRAKMRDVLSRSFAGLIPFHRLPNHIEAQPNKIFEYMSSGIPVIASDFPLWREIVEDNECGICVDPEQPREIASAIDKLYANKDMARDMGNKGRRAVHELYSWATEESQLVRFYADLEMRPCDRKVQ